MKQPKLFFLAAIAATALASCSSNDDLAATDGAVTEPAAIGFDSYLGRNVSALDATRGEDQTVDKLKTSGFGVYAYQSSSEYNASTGTFSPNLMSNQKVTHDNTNWTYSPKKYWPQTGYVAFLAYAPYAASGYSLVNSEGIESGNRKYLKGFSVNSTISEQVDLLWNTTDHLKEQLTTNRVKMTFAHALSRIGFNITSSAADKNTTITIESVTLSGGSSGTANTDTGVFNPAGTLDLSATSLTATGLWTIAEGLTKLAFTLGSSDLNAITLQSSSASITNNDDKFLMVLPEDFSYTGEDNFNAKLFLTVKYKVKTTDTSVTGDALEFEYTVSKPLNLKLAAGNAYTLNVKVGPTPIEFDVESTITAWTETGNSKDITL